MESKAMGHLAFLETQDLKTPHNAYASEPKLRQAIRPAVMRMCTRRAMRGIILLRRRVRRCAFEDGIAAAKVVPGYQLSNPWFEYHPEDGLYYRYQYGGPHMGYERTDSG